MNVEKPVVRRSAFLLGGGGAGGGRLEGKDNNQIRQGFTVQPARFTF